MPNLIFVYDNQLDREKIDQCLELFDPKPKQEIAYQDMGKNEFGKGDILVCLISDSQVKELIPQIIDSEAGLALLPHEELIHGQKGFGINKNMESAIDEIQSIESIEPIDLMLVNDELVLNSLVIGESLSILYGDRFNGFFEGLKNRFSQFLKLFRRVKLQKLQISFPSKEDENKDVDTAAMGILAVANCQSNAIFRRIIRDSGINDQLIHVMILAPKSLISIIRFGIQSLFFPIKENKLPRFVGYASSEEVKIKTEEDICYAIDGEEKEGNEITIKVQEKPVRILLGAQVREEEVGKGKEIQNLKTLPTGSLRDELAKGYLPWVRHATSDEFKELFKLLRENSQTTGTYLVLMVLSTMIATFGLFGDSSPVVIGAMILAPLMAPIISLSMGMLRQDSLLIKNSLVTIFWGVLLGLIFSMLITWMTPLEILNDQILARIRPNLLDLGVAVASGMAGAYAYSKEEIAKTLAGVAISVALVPPLAVAGIGLGWADWNVFFGALLLLGTNLAGIVVAAALTFLTLGFSPFRLAKKGLVISLILLAAIATPLALSFSKMVNENRIIQELSGQEIPHGLLRNVKVVNMQPLRLAVTILSEKDLKEADFEEIRTEIEDKIGKPIQLELTLGIRLGEGEKGDITNTISTDE
ncbi:putative hydrophobic protein (TIGR00271 family) [Algoriphagus iocasae]|uniref:Putative hydrophobic protein (TIGR00271 family) n=1 Tax=Algoriphagus iocasae TaxID=1836499 RepID=A0A841MBF6_9BACT|nr:TIGR00341 family protein [Algoriphagus iocasae]MBB6324640.1 putative hydrophobic protein (TIGR00271 family) [Algoriphagus iocasae]